MDRRRPDLDQYLNQNVYDVQADLYPQADSFRVEFKGTRDPEDIVKRFSDVAVDALPQGDRLFEEKARDPQFSEYLKRQSGMQHAAKVLRDVRMARFGVAKDQINELFGGAAGQQLDTRALFLVSPPDLASLAIGVFDAPRDTFKNVTTLPDFINRLTTAGLSSTELRNQFVKFLKIANDYYRGHRKMDTSGNYYSAKVDMTKMKLGSTHEDGYYDVAVGEGVGVAPVSMALAPKQAFQHIQDSLAGVTVSNPIMKGREQFQNLVKDTMAVVDNGLYKEKELLLRYKASFAYKAFDRIRDQLLSTDVAISTVTYTVNPGANDPQAGLFSVIDLPPVNGVLVPPHVIRVSIRGRSISLNEGQFGLYYMFALNQQVPGFQPVAFNGQALFPNAVAPAAFLNTISNATKIVDPAAYEMLPLIRFGRNIKKSFEFRLQPYYGYVDSMFNILNIPVASTKALNFATNTPSTVMNWGEGVIQHFNRCTITLMSQRETKQHVEYGGSTVQQVFDEEYRTLVTNWNKVMTTAVPLPWWSEAAQQYTTSIDLKPADRGLLTSWTTNFNSATNTSNVRAALDAFFTDVGRARNQGPTYSVPGHLNLSTATSYQDMLTVDDALNMYSFITFYGQHSSTSGALRGFFGGGSSTYNVFKWTGGNVNSWQLSPIEITSTDNLASIAIKLAPFRRSFFEYQSMYTSLISTMIRASQNLINSFGYGKAILAGDSVLTPSTLASVWGAHVGNPLNSLRHSFTPYPEVLPHIPQELNRGAYAQLSADQLNVVQRRVRNASSINYDNHAPWAREADINVDGATLAEILHSLLGVPTVKWRKLIKYDPNKLDALREEISMNRPLKVSSNTSTPVAVDKMTICRTDMELKDHLLARLNLATDSFARIVQSSTTLQRYFRTDTRLCITLPKLPRNTEVVVYTETFPDWKSYLSYVLFLQYQRTFSYGKQLEYKKISQNRVDNFLQGDAKQLKKLIGTFGGDADYLDKYTRRSK